MTCSHDSLLSDSARHASYAHFCEIDDRASPRAGDRRLCMPIVVTGTVGRRAGRPALDQAWPYRSARPWRDAVTSAQPTPLHRAWRDSGGQLMLVRGVADRVQDGEVSARSWSVPCRWAGGGSVPDPAKDVAGDVRDAPGGQPLRARARPRRGRLRSGGRTLTLHPPAQRGAAHHRSGPAPPVTGMT